MKLNPKNYLLFILLGFPLVIFGFLSQNDQGFVHNDEILANSFQNGNLKSSDYWVLSNITIDGDATGVGAKNWTWAVGEFWCSGSGTWNNPYRIENVTINGKNSINCIYIRDSDVYFKIKNCTLYNSSTTTAGLKFYNVTNGILLFNNCSNNKGSGIYMYKSHNFTISDNLIESNGHEGLYLYQSDFNAIINNTVSNNEEEGINMYYSDNITIINNTANYNEIDGISVSSGHNIVISYNNAHYNSEDGIYLSSTQDSENKIEFNTATKNGYAGIHLSNCVYSYITGNFANNNGKYGIKLSSTDHALITQNTANQNNYGIYLSYSDNNEVSKNIVGNNEYGIYISDSDDNLISENTLENNIHCIVEDGYCSGNILENNICIPQDYTALITLIIIISIIVIPLSIVAWIVIKLIRKQDFVLDRDTEKVKKSIKS